MNGIIAFLKSNKKLSLLIAALIVLLAFFSIFDSEAKESVGVETTDLSSYAETLQIELSELCSSIDGVGKCRVYVSFYKGEESVYKNGVLVEYNPPRVLGVFVVCQGGDRADVRRELTELFSSLFDLGANRVKISKLK